MNRWEHPPKKKENKTVAGHIFYLKIYFQFSPVAQSYPTLWDPMDCRMPGFPVHHQLPELTQTHVHWVDGIIRFHHFMANRWENNERLYFLGLQNHCRWWLQPWNLKTLVPGRKSMTNLDSILKSRDITLPTKVCLVKALVVPVVMYGCESWTKRKLSAEELVLLNCGVGEQSPLDCKEIQPVHPKGNQSWIFIWRTDAEAEAPILWPPRVKNWLTGKDPDARNDWRQEEKGMTEAEMVGWHHWLNGH